MKRKLLLCLIVGLIFVFGCTKTDSNNNDNNNQSGTITDIDGNVYDTVRIGTQTWMAENLKTTKYNDGTPIPLVSHDTTHICDSCPAYMWYNTDPSNKNVYGALYNWFAVNTGKLAPIGWHVPSYDDWITLVTYLGGGSVAGGKMKEIGTTHWNSPNTNATNESGFTAISCGILYVSGQFIGMGNSTYFWSSTQETPIEGSSTNSWALSLFCWLGRVEGNYQFKPQGISVRCIKDQ